MLSTFYKTTALLFVFALTCPGCGGSTGKSRVKHLSGRSKAMNRQNTATVKSKLYAQYKEWQGVPYKNKGLTKNGIDCSGFVHVTFLERLGRAIPRTTARLSNYGNKIQRRSLMAGDLVFFKTGTKKRHVGIYVEEGKFLHASTSKGVIISRLDNVYWEKHFWQARRI